MRRRRRGLSMMEVLVSLAIVTVVAGSIGAYVPLRDRALAREFRATAARQEVAGELERLAHARDWEVGTTERALDDDVARIVGAATLSVRITRLRPGLFECEASLTYREDDGPRRESLTTLVADEGEVR